MFLPTIPIIKSLVLSNHHDTKFTLFPPNIIPLNRQSYRSGGGSVWVVRMTTLAFMASLLREEGQRPNSWECELSYVCVELKRKHKSPSCETLPQAPLLDSRHAVQPRDGWRSVLLSVTAFIWFLLVPLNSSVKQINMSCTQANKITRRPYE